MTESPLERIEREIASIDAAIAEGRGPKGILSELAAGRDPFAACNCDGEWWGGEHGASDA